jgi:hypothetical protein
MNGRSRAFLSSCAAAAGVALPATVAGQPSPPVVTYVVTTVGASGAGNVVARETLSLQRTGMTSRLRIASADGSVLSMPVRYAANGEIASNSQDSAVTCYNMAMDVAARTREPAASDPASVFVRFGTSIVQVPLTVRATQFRGSHSDVALEGRSTGVLSAANSAVDAGIMIDAAIEQNGDDLSSATFDEVHYAGSPAQIISRSTCTLRRTEQRPATRT